MGKWRVCLGREFRGLLTYVALESDVIGFFLALWTVLGLPPTKKWPRFRFGFERRFFHLLLCILITFGIQAAMHFRESTCLDREDCLEACKEGSPLTLVPKSFGTNRSEVQRCSPIKKLQIGPESASLHWFVYPKTHVSMNTKWADCRRKADDVFLGHLHSCVSLRAVVCVPACRDISDPLVLYPDDRPLCSDSLQQATEITTVNEIAEMINSVTRSSLSETLICAAPDTLCLTIDYPKSFRIGFVALLYQFVSVLVRTLLLCTFVSKSKRGGARRLGSIIIFLLAGSSVFILMFDLLSVPLWLKEAFLSLLASYAVQLGIIMVLRWFLLGSIQCSKLDRKRLVFGIRRIALRMKGGVSYNLVILYSTEYEHTTRRNPNFLDMPNTESGDEDYGF